MGTLGYCICRYCLYVVLLLAFTVTSGNSKIEYYNHVYVPNIPIFDEKSKEIYLEEYEDKLLLIVFWATWCPYCIQEIKELDILQKDFRKLPISILPVSEDYNGIYVIQQFYKQHGIKRLKIFYDYRNKLMYHFGVTGMPSAILVDKDGLVICKITGYINWTLDSSRELLMSYMDGSNKQPRNSSDQ